MCKYLSPQPYSSHLQRLALRLVDGDSKSRPDRELATLPLEGVLIWLWNEGNAWNKNNSSSFYDSALEQLVINTPVKDQAGPITQTLAWVDVA